MRTPVIIEVAINGVTGKDRNPHVPCTPDEIANDALRCLAAGAAIVHNHLDGAPADGADAAEPYLAAWRPILAARPDANLYPTVGAGATIEERYAHVARLAPFLRLGVADGVAGGGRRRARGVGATPPRAAASGPSARRARGPWRPSVAEQGGAGAHGRGAGARGWPPGGQLRGSGPHPGTAAVAAHGLRPGLRVLRVEPSDGRGLLRGGGHPRPVARGARRDHRVRRRRRRLDGSARRCGAGRGREGDRRAAALHVRP